MALADLNPATVVERQETRLLVRRAIDELPEHERTVTLLFYSTGYALMDGFPDKVRLLMEEYGERIETQA